MSESNKIKVSELYRGGLFNHCSITDKGNITTIEISVIGIRGVFRIKCNREDHDKGKLTIIEEDEIDHSLYEKIKSKLGL